MLFILAYMYVSFCEYEGLIKHMFILAYMYVSCCEYEGL